MNTRFFLLSLSPLLATAAVHAQILSETFGYSSGNLTTVSSAAWAAHSGAGSNPVQVNASGAAVLRGGSAEDVNRSLGSTYTDGTLWASFDLDFSTGTIAASGVNTYVLHFKDDTTGFRGRVFIGSSTAADTDLFRLGIENDAGDGGTAIFTSDLDRTSVHSVTVAYDITAKTSKLWVDAPTSGPATVQDTAAATSALSMSAVGLRQGGSIASTGNYTGLQIDNLVVSYTPVPEPEEWAAIVGAGLVGFALWRRRR
jgi:hypothetical protein